MKPISHQATALIGKERGLSASTHKAHMDCIRKIGEYLSDKFGLQNINSVGGKHVTEFFKDKANLSNSRLEAYATSWRMIAEAVGKNNMVPRENEELGFSRNADERYAPKFADQDRINELRESLVERAGKTEELKDTMLVLAHDMRQEFGLRAKESLMSKEVVRIDGKEFLKVEGAKGDRPRNIEIKTHSQREAIAKVQAHMSATGQKSIIPADMKLVQAISYQTDRIHELGGTKESRANMHCQRHAFLQKTYNEQKTEYKAQGMSDEMSKAMALKDVAEVAGHSRPEAALHYINP